MSTKSAANPEKADNGPGFKGRELARAAKGVERDLLGVLLEPEKLYTLQEAEKILAKAMEKGVNADAGR